MAVFFLLLAILGGALVGDLVWENTTLGEATVLDRTVVSYPQGWLLAAAAALGFVVALLLVASVSSKGPAQSPSAASFHEAPPGW